MRLSILAACIGLLFLLSADCHAGKCKGGSCAVEAAKAPAAAKTVEKAAVTENKPNKRGLFHRGLFRRHHRKGCKSC